MNGADARWAWRQSSRAGSDVIAVVLVKKDHSIALTFPKPKSWTGERQEDEDFVRAMLFAAAEERWSGRPSTH